MEVLDEYDAPVPLRATFCQLISTETFERQATTHTKRALRRLFRSLDRDPALAERVVRWHKQREREGRGWASFVKARLCQALQGDFNYSNRMDAAEERWRLDQLKREMQRVYIYTREPGHSRKRRRHQGAVPAADPTLSPAPPGPSSVPAPVFMPKVFGPFPPPTHQQRPTEPDPAGSLPWRLPLLPSARRPQQGPRALHLSAMSQPRPQRWLPPEG
ncbi:protein png1-like isoform X5 [Tachyglossus aculeatus]|uniref:protein png1-like isoform X5 n=1 Tax=Tachyglossus aculeatus TaxID=9261 RepID=UPI0018F3BFBC|nr:protein png1-like isoform X5 [Tachyglossus aculeatus]